MPTKLKKHPQKLFKNTQFFLSILPWAAQMDHQKEEFMFQNVAYRPTVYKTGVSNKHNDKSPGHDSKIDLI